MEGTFKKELKLAKDLKSICGGTGKEKDAIKSSKILHELGVLYKDKSPDKISLIQSAALLNAAIMRQPTSEKILADLESLCSHILQVAGAEKSDADLIGISRNVAEKVKRMRKETEEKLSTMERLPLDLPEERLHQMEIEKVSRIRQIQNELFEKYTSIMKEVSEKCIEIMGKPPCRYSVSGMGSLARKELTPFSDFEHVVVLEECAQFSNNYEEILEYFRWFSVIFHVILINLKETNLPSVAVPWLNDFTIPNGNWFFDSFTVKGISFDKMIPHACNFPLAVTKESRKKMELIKPITEMVKYLKTAINLKNGYHLADVLTKICFVSGFKGVHDRFQAEARQALFNSLAPDEQITIQSEKGNLRIQTKISASNFTALRFYYTSDIKQFIYKEISILVSILGRIHSINKNSCFDVVDVMKRKRLISEATAHKLSYALAVSCETRLKVHMSQKSQGDSLHERIFNFGDTETVRKLIHLVGEQSLSDCITICYSLQEAIRTNNAPALKNLSCNFVKRFEVYYLYSLWGRLLEEWKKYNKSVPESRSDDLWIRALVAATQSENNKCAEALQLLDSVLDNARDCPPRVQLQAIDTKINCLFKLGRFGEAMKFLQGSKPTLGSPKQPPSETCLAFGHCYFAEGTIHEQQKAYMLAISCFNESLQYFERSGQQNLELFVASCHLRSGVCNFNLQNVDEAIKHFHRGIEISKPLYVPQNIKLDCYQFLSKCYAVKGDQEKAMQYNHMHRDLSNELPRSK